MSINRKKFAIFAIAGAICATVGGAAISQAVEDQRWNRTCDGVEITETCKDESGKRYKKYVFHEAEPEKTKEVFHEAEPEKTHIVHHDAVYGTRQVAVDCIRTNIKYKNGTCALSRCRDGMYSGSAGWGACNYHGGVAQSGGPWYTYREERYVITPAWDETIVDVPAKDAWTETVIVSPAKEAWTERVLAE